MKRVAPSTHRRWLQTLTLCQFVRPQQKTIRWKLTEEILVWNTVSGVRRSLSCHAVWLPAFPSLGKWENRRKVNRSLWTWTCGIRGPVYHRGKNTIDRCTPSSHLRKLYSPKSHLQALLLLLLLNSFEAGLAINLFIVVVNYFLLIFWCSRRKGK